MFNSYKLKNNHIAIACDDHFVNHAIAMINSLYNSNSEFTFHFHILDSNIMWKNKLKLIIFFIRIGFKFSFYKVDYSKIRNAPVSDHISLASYNRIFLSSLINQSIDKIIYLDCDIIITGSIKELINCDISNHYLAASREIIDLSDQKRLNLKINDYYFNAGVMIINLKKWREDKVENQLINFICSSSEKIKYWDQDVLNYCFKNKWLRLNPNLNLTHFYFFPDFFPPSYFELNDEKYNEYVSNPIVIHFTSRNKPWMPRCNHPKRDLYHKYLVPYSKLIFGKLKNNAV